MPFKKIEGGELEALRRSVAEEAPVLASALALGDWRAYENGSYKVLLDLDSGTKIRVQDDDDAPFSADVPESMDVKITNRCSAGCPMCHEDSTPCGKHADLSQAFIDTIHPYTEIAVGGGDVFEHPDLERFLTMLAERECIPSVTVRQSRLLADGGKAKDALIDYRRRGLVYGIGVSLDEPTDGLVDAMRELGSSCVLHVINGMFSRGDYERLRGRGLKILVLGYKDVRRGADYHAGAHGEEIEKNMRWLSEHLADVVEGFEVVSFDNLALEQLPVRDFLGEDLWDGFYMGDDGTATFYIDMVEKEYAVSSTSAATDRREIGGKSVEEMFADIKRFVRARKTRTAR